MDTSQAKAIEPPPEGFGTCSNDILCNYGVPGSDHYEPCGTELCEHGQCSICDRRCVECPRTPDPLHEPQDDNPGPDINF